MNIFRDKLGAYLKILLVKHITPFLVVKVAYSLLLTLKVLCTTELVLQWTNPLEQAGRDIKL